MLVGLLRIPPLARLLCYGADFIEATLLGIEIRATISDCLGGTAKAGGYMALD